jgi:hypothetical protein
MLVSRYISSGLLAAFLATAVPCSAADKYTDASVDDSGRLSIRTSDGRSVILPKDRDQTGFDRIALSANGHAVGWVNLYPNCCTSYPIPLKLALYMDGKLHTFTGSELPIWRWNFTVDGERVAFEQETVHGGLGVHYELRDIVTERLVSEYNPPIGPDGQVLENQAVPQWVADLNGKWH